MASVDGFDTVLVPHLPLASDKIGVVFGGAFMLTQRYSESVRKDDLVDPSWNNDAMRIFGLRSEAFK